MKQLFTIDTKDYDPAWKKFYRPSVRGIILDQDHKIALIYSQKFHIYKFPGGGIEPGEDHLTALAREINEETGMTLIPESVQEFGEVLRIQGSGKLKDTILSKKTIIISVKLPVKSMSNISTNLKRQLILFLNLLHSTKPLPPIQIQISTSVLSTRELSTANAAFLNWSEIQ
jgi:hydrolase, NUDIX family